MFRSSGFDLKSRREPGESADWFEQVKSKIDFIKEISGSGGNFINPVKHLMWNRLYKNVEYVKH